MSALLQAHQPHKLFETVSDEVVVCLVDAEPVNLKILQEASPPKEYIFSE
jgi:hypothetical protein